MRGDGLDALSIRRLAADLGVTSSALYRYVPDKARLIRLMVDQVWTQILLGMPSSAPDLVEWTIEINLRVRRTWLDNLELAHYATAVLDPSDYRSRVQLMSSILDAAGFTDVPQTFYAIQTLTLGSVTVAATRARASRCFGLDPDQTWETARRQLVGDDPDLVGILDTGFDIGDERHFEPVLRLLTHALLGAPDEPA